MSSASARQIRKTFRHYFLRRRGLKLGYDVVTWASTQLTICYTVMPFLLLSVEPTFIYYRCVNCFYTSVIFCLNIWSCSSPVDCPGGGGMTPRLTDVKLALSLFEDFSLA